MSRLPKTKISFDEYLGTERMDQFKSEYLHGEAFEMFGGSPDAFHFLSIGLERGL